MIMKLKLLLIAYILLVGCSHDCACSQKIFDTSYTVQLNKMEELNTLLESQTQKCDPRNIWVIFDFSYTLLYPIEPALHKKNKLAYASTLNCLLKSLTKEERDLLFNNSTKAENQKLVNDSIPSIIKKFNGQGVTFLICTGSLSKIDGKNNTDIIANLLNSHGVHLGSNNFPFNDTSLDGFNEYLGGRPHYKNGIITANKENKGKVLSSFLKKIHNKPKMIFFVDNSGRKVNDVRDITNDFCDIKLITCEYMECKNTDTKNISEREFTDFWKKQILDAQNKLSLIKSKEPQIQ